MKRASWRLSESGLAVGVGTGGARTARVDLGLALLSVLAKPGVPLALNDIAAWCGVSDNAISLIEQAALKKLRRLARATKDPVIRGLLDHLRPPRAPRGHGRARLRYSDLT